MSTSSKCPFCDLDGGFHDEFIHNSMSFVPKDKLLPIASETRKANEDFCGNCGAAYSSQGIPPCRNPKHKQK